MRPLALLAVLLSGCAEDPDLVFPAGFQWGAATSAHQIEGGNTNNNWHQFETLPRFAGKTKDASGKAADSYRRFDEDARIASEMALDVYRFSLEWSRIEPARDMWDEAALAHYDQVIDAVVARGLRPVVTLHHFTDPIWVQDLSRLDACPGTVDDTNLCGWTNPEVRDEWVEFVEHVVARYGDRVDTWITINEPVANLFAGYLFGVFPPGKMFQPYESVVPVLRNLLDAHARAHAAIHRVDVHDADGDGAAAVVGVTQSVGWYVPADPAREADRSAADQATYFMNHLFTDALFFGALDTDLDLTRDEPHPEWKDKLDFVGLQYYYRAPTANFELVSPISFMFCMESVDNYIPQLSKMLGCPQVDPVDVTLMGYEHHPEGLYQVVKAFAARFPGVPLMVTENGISTRSGRRRAQSIVRHLQWLHRAIDEGIDIRGYTHWSLIDNFEWAEGYEQPFGLYRVDFDTFARTATEGAQVLRQIAADNAVSSELCQRYGEGPMAPEAR